MPASSAAFGDWLAGQPERADAVDARRPEPAELAAALERTRSRERAILDAPLAPLRDRLALPYDLEDAAVRRRRELEDEFLAELIAREQALIEQAAELHRAYAELHAERDGVHRAYADLHAEHDRVQRAYAADYAELERVHRAYAELWDDRERLRELAGEPALATEEHA